MTFKPEEIPQFQALFESNMHAIRQFDGVEKLELYRDKNQSNIFFTYSFWKSEDHLEKYRQSHLFQMVWTQTKSLFEAKPEAWTVKTEVSL